MTNLQIRRNGFAALSLILIISAVMLTVIGTVSYLSIGEGQASLVLELGENNLSVVEGCAESLLQSVHDNASYSATSFTLDGNTCSVSYASGGPTNWDATVFSTQNGFTRKIRIVFTRGVSNMSLTSWQEI